MRLKKSTKRSISEKGLFQKISLFFYDHIKFSIFFWISIFLFGLFSYTTFMQRQGFPQVSVPISTVQVVYLANDKNKVDSEVTEPILNAIQNDPSIKKTTANSTPNASVIVVQHKDEYSSQDGSNSIQNTLKQSNFKLPSSAKVEFNPIEATKFNNKYDLLISVSGNNKTNKELSDSANEIASQLNDKFSQVKSSEIIPLVTTGINPISGQPQSKQTQFDWIGQNKDGVTKLNNSIIIGLNLENNTDVVKFNEPLTNELSRLNQEYSSKGLNVISAASFAENIESQTNSLQKNLLEGLIIVVIVCFIFIGFRAGLTAAIAMLVTLSLSVGILYIIGVTLNTITLFGLVLCLGLIVDDIVIVAESIDTERKKNESLRESIKKSIGKIATASSAGTLTTSLGFAPLLFFGGILGKFIRVLPITIIISLLVSLFVSLTFVPFFTRVFNRTSPKVYKYSPFLYFRKFIDWISNGLSRIILSANTTARKVIYSILAIGFSLTFLLASGPVYQKLKFDIFPNPKDSNEIQVEYTFLPNTTIEKAKDITKTSNEIISNTLGNDIQKITYRGNANERQALANITLTPTEDRETTSKEYVEKLNTNLSIIKDAKIYASQISAGPPKQKLPFAVQINANDIKKANIAANNLVKFINEAEIKRSNGTKIKVSETEFTGEQISITRINGSKIIEVRAGFEDQDTSALVAAAQKNIENNFLNNKDNLAGLNSSDFKFDFGTESQNQDSFKTVIATIPVLALLMYILLLIQFKSFLQPLLILIAVPFSFFGVGIALNISQNPLSFFTMIGFFALIGVSVNNTILLTDYANQERKLGYSPTESMSRAIKERFRPLATTTITAVCALIPLALSDPFWENLAFTLIGGLISSAILVVIAFPYYYLVLEFLRNKTKLKFRQLTKR